MRRVRSHTQGVLMKWCGGLPWWVDGPRLSLATVRDGTPHCRLTLAGMLVCYPRASYPLGVQVC